MTTETRTPLIVQAVDLTALRDDLSAAGWTYHPERSDDDKIAMRKWLVSMEYCVCIAVSNTPIMGVHVEVKSFAVGSEQPTELRYLTEVTEAIHRHVIEREYQGVR